MDVVWVAPAHCGLRMLAGPSVAFILSIPQRRNAFGLPHTLPGPTWRPSLPESFASRIISTESQNIAKECAEYGSSEANAPVAPLRKSRDQMRACAVLTQSWTSSSCERSNIHCKRKSDLRRHENTVHQVRNEYWCPFPACDRRHDPNGVRKPFPRKDKRDDHVKEVHGKRTLTPDTLIDPTASCTRQFLTETFVTTENRGPTLSSSVPNNFESLNAFDTSTVAASHLAPSDTTEISSLDGIEAPPNTSSTHGGLDGRKVRDINFGMSLITPFAEASAFEHDLSQYIALEAQRNIQIAGNAAFDFGFDESTVSSFVDNIDVESKIGQNPAEGHVRLSAYDPLISMNHHWMEDIGSGGSIQDAMSELDPLLLFGGNNEDNARINFQ
ncbi:hypothetical protein NA57DRAFT_56387 [Rhizodiscina lignyota]|uniref:Uncharacterized protein n=1 Tax=Rhizodiscina lignyota TaxID=1504668 RepID=A0A9P4M5H4_9PEZI|nr:hypothetical protein NA57DRAFT_56387 [Rhizodiscina lignyota]